ncbi:MAG: AmmeMemoRadiSam system radical SAM enzyme [Ancrocorticia sp.]|nr:AmmeMemoRadiSam system radical SAM enzyme [Ancrocorticia sp.]MCI2002236.1 AmmeMemoRadiSam system radical SAM enzyme [Ancrocorticia sp.]
MSSTTESVATGQLARWWERCADGRVRCVLCPRFCTLRDGQRGFCFVRANSGGELRLTTYGRSSGFAIDPVEKKPLNHFLPGSRVLSFGTAGCNLGCKFCQNWEISKSREWDSLAAEALPEEIASAAASSACASVAFTYNDPVIFAEYAIDTARACRAKGIHPIAVTAGYIEPGPAREFFASMDAANIDLKGFTEEFYRKVTGGRLSTVLTTLQIAQDSGCWVEITTLLIPGLNDSDEEIAAMAEWIVSHLGPDVPHHFSAFHPDFRMMDRPPTPPETLKRAREIAMRSGEHFVYTGNISDPRGQSTYCPRCGAVAVKRNWYVTEVVGVNARADGTGTCTHCGTKLPGVWR